MRSSKGEFVVRVVVEVVMAARNTFYRYPLTSLILGLVG